MTYCTLLWHDLINRPVLGYISGGGGGGVLGLIFAGDVPLASLSHYPITFGQICNFRDPNLVTSILMN